MILQVQVITIIHHPVIRQIRDISHFSAICVGNTATIKIIKERRGVDQSSMRISNHPIEFQIQLPEQKMFFLQLGVYTGCPDFCPGMTDIRLYTLGFFITVIPDKFQLGLVEVMIRKLKRRPEFPHFQAVMIPFDFQIIDIRRSDRVIISGKGPSREKSKSHICFIKIMRNTSRRIMHAVRLVAIRQIIIPVFGIYRHHINRTS